MHMSVTGWPDTTPDVPARRETRPADVPAKRARKRVRFVRAVLMVAGLATAVVAGDFAHFVWTVTTAAPPVDARADGIVVLTGGAERIPNGIALLAAGRGSRMLISGVNPQVSDVAVAKDKPSLAAFNNCCVDFGREAADTTGNAAEARKWVEAHGFRSVMVVTSAYHIPRSLAEFSEALPDRTLIAYPVVRSELGLDAWWRNPAAARLLGAEYLKYLLARARLLVERAGGPSTGAERSTTL
jgi:uncharacterized SAM-binding protein YcdF (DUF218 family)